MAAPCCPVCKGKVLPLSSQSLHLFQRHRAKLGLLCENSSQSPSSKGREHFENLTQPECLKRLCMEFFSRKYKTMGGYGFLKLIFRGGGMQGIHIRLAECMKMLCASLFRILCKAIHKAALLPSKRKEQVL